MNKPKVGIYKLINTEGYLRSHKDNRDLYNDIYKLKWYFRITDISENGTGLISEGMGVIETTITHHTNEWQFFKFIKPL